MIGAVAAFLMASPASAQSPALKDLPPRVEVYSFPTLTISDTQFLSGDERARRSPSLGNSASPRAQAAFLSRCSCTARAGSAGISGTGSAS